MNKSRTTKNLSAFGLRAMYSLMVLFMLLSAFGIQPVSAASPSTISGNAGVAGATITWNGSGSGSDGSMTADGSGNYSFQVTYSLYWSGTVTPSKTGYTFSPSSRTYSYLTSNQTNQNYTATAVTYTISGSTGTAGANATITYTGGSTTANSSGSYSFAVAGGWSGTVTPTKTGYTFSPVNRSYTNVTSNQTSQNYTATLSGYTISGNVGVGSATITYTGGSTTANSSGDYSFFVSPGWSGTVAPSRTGFAFWPASKSYTNVNANQTAQNYTARPTVFTFGSFGDSHNEPYFSGTADQLASLNPAFIIEVGDIEDNGFSTTEMNSAVTYLKSESLYNKTFMTRGNHDDKLAGSAAGWESYFETSPNIPTRPAYVANKASLNSSSDNLTYSFDYGNSIFISLDVPGDVYLLTQAEVDFLDARLTYAEGAGLTHAFIYFHGPEYCVELEHCTSSARDDSSNTPPALMTVINNHPIVSATFHGHEHVMTWTHMDNTRVSDLTRSYEEFVTSPAGASSYTDEVYPGRVDYVYPDMAPDDQAFATISVNGLSFTVNFYEVGITAPVWSHTFSKINNPPTISDITDKTTNEDTTTGAISFTVGDVELNPAFLTVTATSSDTTLVPAGNIALGGADANRTIDILPAPNQSGSATITVSVNDGNVTVDDTFVLTVIAVNDAPVADPQSVSMPWNSSMNIVLTGSDVEESPLTFEIVDDPQHGSLSGSDVNRLYTPTAGYSGTDSFTFKTYDGALYSLPATVSINVTAYTISGNAGVAGATLSYTDGTPKTVSADGSGLYSFQVPTGWSGMVTPSKAGYNFSPASMSYTNVQADQTAQNYSVSGVVVTISGNAGVAGATLTYTDGTIKTATADGDGLYSLDVSYNWSGTVTPSKTGLGFLPASRTYANVIVNQDSQNYTTTTARVYYVDNTNPDCTDVGSVASMAVPFCTIGRGANFATAGQIVQVLHGTYPETVMPTNFNGTAGHPISFLADPGVIVTGRPGTSTTSYAGFALSGRSNIVIDGFTFDHTSQQGIYVDESSNITITNNHVKYAGVNAPFHPYTQGIYTRNTSNSTITGNITDYNTCIGIRVVGGTQNLISNNISYENFSLVETDAAGIELTGSSYNTVINNIVYSNEDSGINLYYWDTNSVGSTHNLVIGNLSYENGDHGIDNYQSPYNTIVSNTVQGNGTTGINFEGQTSAAGSFGAVVANNIMSQNGTTPPSGSWGGNLRFDVNSITGSTTDYNLFYRTAATVQIIWNNTNYTSLALFKTATPGQEVHGLEGNPLFVNPVAPVLRQTGVPYDGRGIFGNYYTSVGSPAIDSANADAPSEQAFDIDGNSRIDDPGTPNTGAGVRTFDDRGAYEYLPAGPSLPVVTTQAVSNIGLTSATGNGTVAATGLPNPTQHGVVWGFYANPTILDNKTVDGPISAPGAFTSNITDLTQGTLYHVRAYATNEVGTVYGEDVTFTTLLAPAVTTQAVTAITATTATGHGNVIAMGVPNPTQHGVVWNTTGTPTISDSHTSDGAVSAIGAFTSAMTGLTPGTLYYVRAYVTNDAATVYGEEVVTFTSLIVPTVTTQAVTNILTTTAVGNGNITSLGIHNPTQHGVVWALTVNPTTANSKTTDGPVSATGAFTSNITGLTPNTLYHVRAYATNDAGTAYGEDVTFTTLLAPTVTTQAVTNINMTTATGNGNITVLGIPNPTQHGVVWSTSLNPTIADNKTTDGSVTAIGPFTSSITGLTPGTLYHVRAYATNDGGTSYGNDVTFTTLIAPTVTTQVVTNITQTTAMGNGTIVSLGVPNPTQYGFVWDINVNPTVALSTRTEKGPASVTGAFTSNITGLSLGQTYHIRAYATNAVSTAYGEDVVFTTLASSSQTTTSATNAQTGVDVSTTGTATWLNPGNITTADSTYAQVTLNGATSHYLEGTNYGFTLPANATINGIQVTIGRYESGQSSGNDVRDSVVKLMQSGTVVGNNKAATSTEWPTANTVATYGANNDLWGATWLAADINASNFGVALAANSDNNRTAYVDYMQIAVTYTVSIVSSTTSVNCGAGTPVTYYATGITCVATVTRGSGTFTPTGTANWATNGSGSFTPTSCTLSGGGATATCSVSYTPSAVGTGSHQITATYGGDINFNGSNGSQTVTVNKKPATVTPDALSKVLHVPANPDPVLTGTLTGFLPADNVTATYARTPGETVGTYPITATLSPEGVLVNYEITYTPVNFTITAPPEEYTLTINIVGTGVVTKSPDQATYHYGDVVTLAAYPVVGWTFTGWTPALTDNKVTILGNTTVTATFTKIEYSLTINITGNGSVTKNPDKTTYQYDDVVGLVATPDPGWSFGGWSANVVNGNVTIHSNTVVTALFTQDNYNLTINKVGNGTVTKVPDQPTYLYGDVVTLTATPDPGWTFASWAPVLTDNKVTIHGNTTVTATFTPIEYTLTIEKIGLGTVTKAPDQATYHYGNEVTLSATAEDGWEFVGWSENVVDEKITIQDNVTVTATFRQFVLPTVTTQAVTDITKTTATGNGNVTDLGSPIPTQHGMVWSTSADPTIADSKTEDGPLSATGAFTSSITGLTPGTLYHVRAYATNAQGTAYGNDVTFTSRVEPTVTTQAVTAITSTTATGNGNITSLGVPNPTQHGVVWSTSADPTIADSKTTDGPVSTTGAFTSSITGLDSYTLYHVRAYATNTAGTAYGTDVEFTTAMLAPAVTTQAVTDITDTTATGNGNITSLGMPSATEYGVVWDTAANPTIALSTKTQQGVPSGTGAFTSAITGLTQGTLYHVRAYISNAVDTFYGDDLTFTAIYGVVTSTANTNARTGANATGIGTLAWTNPGYITADDTSYATASVNQNVTTNYLQGTNYGFNIPANATINGIVVSIGRMTSGSSSPRIRDVVVSLIKGGTISGSNKAATTTDWPTSIAEVTYGTASDLWGGTWTPADINASNFGVALSVNNTNSTSRTASVDYMQITVTYSVPAAPAAPIVTTQAVSAIASTTATGNGTVTNLGVPNPTQYGVVWDTAADPTIALSTKTEQGPRSVTGAFTSSITGLTPNTLYHVRAYATNIVDTVYGGDVTFTTLGVAPTVTTQAVTNITTTTATGNGNVTALGIPNPTDHGVCWATTTNPTTTNSHTSDGPVNVIGAYTDSITGLTPGTLYYVRAYATNPAGTSYGTQVSFTATAATVQTFTTSGSWTAPAGVTSVTVEVWGGGGRGGSVTSTTSSEVAVGGGGGGAYSASIVTVTPGNSYSYVVGAGSTTTTAGGDSSFNTTTVVAKGGNSAADNSTTAASGGAAASGTGTTKYSGGGGAAGNTTTNYGGGGGSSAGTAANGTTATSATGATAPTGGGNGGGGRSSSSGVGTAGSTPGGSGGGAYRSSGTTTYIGGAGANGQVRLTYYVDVNATTTSVNCGAGTPSVNYGSSITCVVTVTRAGGTLTPTGTVSFTTNGAGAFATSPCTLSGTGGSASCSVTYTPSSVGTGSHLITASYSGDSTFLASSGNQAVTVNKIDASVTPDAASKSLGDSDPELTGTLTGFLPADNVTATYSRVAGETAEGSPYTISAVLSPAGVLGNYNITYNTANFTITPPVGDYTLTINTVGSGTVLLVPDQDTYHYGDVVTLSASPAAGWSFGGWSTNVVDGSVTIHGNTTVDATFTQNEYTLTINTVGNGSVSKVPDQPTYQYGDVVDLTATPDDGWVFDHWSAGVVNNSVTMQANITIAATFIVAGPEEYTLTINKVGNGTINVDKAAPYHLNDVVGLTAVADGGWTFAGWTGACTGTDACSVTMDGNKSVTATFTQNAGNVTYDDADLAWTFTGDWNSLSTMTGPYNDTLHYSTTTGDSAEVSFIGQQFQLIYTALVDRGSVDVYIDNVKVVTLNESGPGSWQQTWTSDPLVLGAHTVRFVHAGGSIVDIDAIKVIATANILTNGTYDDASGAMIFTTNWYNYAGPGPYNSTLRFSISTGETVQFSFTGEQFGITYTQMADRGVMDVYVDGSKLTSINEAGPGAWQQTWTSTPLASGTHTVRLVHASGALVDFDAIKVITAATFLGEGKYDGDEPGLIYSTNWYTYAGPDPYASSLLFAFSPGESMQFSFTGEQFELTYTQMADRGVMDVYVDEVKVASIDESGTGAWQQTWTSEPLPAGKHNVRFVLSNGGGVVDIDALQIISTSNVLGAGTFDDVNPAWHFSTYWYTYAGSGPYGDTLRFSINAKDSALVSFSGTQFVLTYSQMSDRGTMDVYVDGVKVATIDENGTGGWQQTWTSGMFSASTHTVRFVHGTGATVDIDAIRVMP